MILRQRQKSPTGKISLYLDIIHNGKRWNKYLRFYLHPIPLNGNLSPDLKAENKKTLSIAKLIRSNIEVKLHSGEYGLTNESNTNASFLEYFQALADKKKTVLETMEIGTVH